jgi:exodeoxyribonuclease-3
MNLGILKIATFNANSVRARLPVIVDWLGKESPHVLCLQETKVQDADFPVQAFEDLDYHCVFRGQKAYNGVAVVSRKPPESVRFGFGDGDAGEEPRLLAATIGDLAIVNTYVPQGFAPESEKFQYKLLWLERLRAYFDRFYKPTSRLVWLGDFNVAPEAMDIYDPDRLLGRVGFHPEEHKALAAVKSWGFVDVFRKHEPGENMYSFWDYRIRNAVDRGLGWRLDHIWATPSMAQTSTRAWIDVAPRVSTRPSDHTFVVAEFHEGHQA